MAIRIDANTIFEDGRVKKVGEVKTPKVEDKKAENTDGGKGTKKGRPSKADKASATQPKADAKAATDGKEV